MSDRLIPLHQLCAELRTTYGNTPSYRAIYSRVMDDLIPVVRATPKSRPLVRREDLPVIASFFGLKTP